MNNSSAARSADSEAAQLEKLLQGCLYSLDQCDSLLHQISEDSFQRSREGISSIGAHMRHILDRFQCFFAGINGPCIDYDARKRDKSIESNLEAAQFATTSIARRLREMNTTASTQVLVRESVHHLSPKLEIDSTVARELMGLITHTTHHLAIIGMIARDLGYTLDGNFGKAPSTIVYESS